LFSSAIGNLQLISFEVSARFAESANAEFSLKGIRVEALKWISFPNGFIASTM
jgi:hypothetical protein